MNSVSFSKVSSPPIDKQPDAAVQTRKKVARPTIRNGSHIRKYRKQLFRFIFYELGGGMLMITKITVAFALVLALSGNVFSSASEDGSDDLGEAFGGTRAGGEC